MRPGAAGGIGVHCDGGAALGLLDRLLAERLAGFEVVSLTLVPPERLGELIEAVHQSGRRAYVVVTSLDEARAGLAAGADALIVKGHESGGWVGEETAFVLLQRLVPRVGVPIWIPGGVGYTRRRRAP